MTSVTVNVIGRLKKFNQPIPHDLLVRIKMCRTGFVPTLAQEKIKIRKSEQNYFQGHLMNKILLFHYHRHHHHHQLSSSSSSTQSTLSGGKNKDVSYWFCTHAGAGKDAD